MLARLSKIRLNSQVELETPLLLTSFSSKGFPEVRDILRMMGEFITDGILVSAYDVHYKNIPTTKVTFPIIIFLDSGGYEARVDHDFSEAYGRGHEPKKWTKVLYKRQVRRWNSRIPTIVVSFDSPTKYVKLTRQIREAKQLTKIRPDLPVEFLVKPEKSDGIVPLPALIEHVEELREFVAVGFTDVELDNTILGRMVKIAQLRKAMDAHAIPIPIHIFGGLDTLSTPLYFISGAEIFDGLTWLRFGYHDGVTVYSQNYGIISDPSGLLSKTKDQVHKMWVNNYYYLAKLRDQMVNYTRTGEFGKFKHIENRLREAYEQVEARISA